MIVLQDGSSHRDLNSSLPLREGREDKKSDLCGSSIPQLRELRDQERLKKVC